MLLLLACAAPAPDTGTVDLVSRLGAGEVRAGVVSDPAALVGGVSAEGRPGDVKIYNDRVQFVIQQPGDSSYYVEYGGGVIDADLVRPDGVPGRDVIDEVGAMIGLGRVVDAQTMTVVSDGSDGVARVRVEGPTAPMHLLTGALEDESLVDDLDLWVVTEYALSPGEYALVVTTTVQSRESADVSVAIGDAAIVAMDVAEPYVPARGLEGADTRAVDWSGVIGQRNEVALALLGETEPLQQGTVGQILGSIAPVIAGFGPTETLPAGGEITWTRRFGVAADLATLSGAQLAWRGTPTRTVSGTVVDPTGAPVGGARVHVLDTAGNPVTVAFADAAGAWSAVVPDADVSVVATGRGPGITVDLPAGHGWYSPYGAQNEAVLATLTEGATPIPFAEGCGVSAPSAPGVVTLPGCGRLSVTVADGGPAVAWLYFTGEDPAVDERLVPGRTGGAAAVGFIRDGQLDLPVEPGTYLAVVHRGVRDEVWHDTVTVGAGGASITASVPRAYTLDGVVTGDPHSHAAPSGDGGVSMEDRLLVAAANGVDVHFGTDHDHIADYRPLLAPLGLEGRLRSVVADEVSPVLRGHFNAYPAQIRGGANNGAPRWWFGYADTSEIFGWMRDLVGATGVIQANHPVGSSGMFSFAGYDPDAGTIDDPASWSDDFGAMEVLNSGDWQEYLPYYLDLARRGKRVTPVGVSDSHGHTSGAVGLVSTFFYSGTDLAGFDDAVLEDTMARGAVAVSKGPLVDVRIGDTPTPGRLLLGGTVVPHIRVYAPSWIPVERVQVWVDGEVVEEIACTGSAPIWCDAQPLLTAAHDVSVVVTADSLTRPIEWAHPGQYAWGLAAAFFLDVDGNGAFDPALAPITATP